LYHWLVTELGLSKNEFISLIVYHYLESFGFSELPVYSTTSDPVLLCWSPPPPPPPPVGGWLLPDGSFLLTLLLLAALFEALAGQSLLLVRSVLGAAKHIYEFWDCVCLNLDPDPEFYRLARVLRLVLE
jgi:hypothetical protein